MPANIGKAPPVYWMNEESGQMADIVKKFLNHDELTAMELNILRWYAFQWVDAMPVKPEDYPRIRKMAQGELSE